MKQLLATTTILALCTGFASAEISMSGSARMGIVDDFGDVGPQFSSRVRIVFTASGETDTGLSFGASVRHDQDDAPGDGYANGDNTVFISGAFGKLTMGDVDGASAAAMGQVDGVGYTGLSDLNELAYLGTGGADPELFDAVAPTPDDISSDTSVLYEYMSGPFGVYVSANQLEYDFNGFSNDASYGVAASYTMDAYKFALGYEMIDVSSGADTWDLRQLSLGVDANLGPVVMKARYAKGTVDGTNGYTQDTKQWAVSGTYTVDALALTAFVSQKEADRTGTIVEQDAYGLGASYDLGGGASVAGGYVKNDTADTDAVDIGLKFSF